MQYAEQVWGLISSTEMEHAEPLDLERAIPGYPGLSAPSTSTGSCSSAEMDKT